MNNRTFARTFVIVTGILMVSAQVLSAQGRPRYREFELGSDVAAVVKLTGTAPSDVKLIHQRPALIQNLEWRPRYSAAGAAPQTDPVDVIMFRFYDNQLFTVIVDYNRQRTNGMTETDMIEAISAAYGPATRPPPKANRAVVLPYGAPDTPLAMWGDSEYSATLLRVAYPETFRLVVASTRLEHLARTAGAEAVRLDASEAPQREVARQKKEAAEALAAQEKAQIENKAVFRP